MSSRIAGVRLAIVLAISFALPGPVAIEHSAARAAGQADQATPTPAQLLDKMVKDFSAKVPEDVDTALQKSLEHQKKFAEVQLLFDIDSWQSLVALCWPVDREGKPLPKLTDPGDPAYTRFIPETEIFDAGPAEPAQAGQVRRNYRFRQVLKRQNVKEGDRVLSLISSVGGDLTEVSQAFAQPIWDQNGFMVRYEILVNKDERDFIVNNGLQTIKGQIAFSQAGKTVTFPSGVYHSGNVGAIELKLAWKVLGASDDPTRFIVTSAKIFSGDDPIAKEVKVGLVGMHIAHKTESSPQWIWSTFMHVDSLQTNALAVNAKTGKPINPLFNNPNCETCPVNVPSTIATPSNPNPYVDGLAPTQVLSLTPIPLATQEVNHKAQAALRGEGSVLQYYELLNTQWPTAPKAKPTPGGPSTAPGSVNNKPGGNPTPVYLVNPLFETYFQLGNQKATQQEEGNPTDDTLVFGTESCMGCHSSAGVAVGTSSPPKPRTIYGPQLSGDFSWLLETKAK
jgi:hypothetical protein